MYMELTGIVKPQGSATTRQHFHSYRSQVRAGAGMKELLAGQVAVGRQASSWSLPAFIQLLPLVCSQQGKSGEVVMEQPTTW